MTLPKNPDRKRTYYKITNKKENHRGLQYHDGLVVDPKPFNSNPIFSCVEGGIYFSTKEYIHRFLEYGCWIRPIRIPKDAKVIVDPSGDKYRADKLFFEPRKDFGWYFDNLFDRKAFPKDRHWMFAKCCSDYFDKWFDKKLFSINGYWALARYCSDHFDKWFDRKLFPRNEYRDLAKYCPDHFDKWFDKRSFPKEHYRALAKYCSDHFDKWFDKNTFPKKEYWRLAQHCPNNFDEWFESFPKDSYWALVEYCQKYCNKWKS